MPRHIQAIGRYGNLALALSFGFLTLYGLFAPGQPVALAFFFACPFALGLFNVWAFRKAAFHLSEEQWLLGEVRKAELRRRLREMAKTDLPEKDATGRDLPGTSTGGEDADGTDGAAAGDPALTGLPGSPPAEPSADRSGPPPASR